MDALANENGATPAQGDADDALAGSSVASEETGLLTDEQIEELAYRAQRAADKDAEIRAARRRALETGDEEALKALLGAHERDDSDVAYAERGLDTRYGVREPWLLHGLNLKRGWLSPDDAALYEQRLEVSDALYKAGHPFAGGRLLFPEFSVRDREDTTSWRPFEMGRALNYESVAAHLVEITERKGGDDKAAEAAAKEVEALIEEDLPAFTERRKQERFEATLDKVAASHEDEHWFFAHPFCRECFPADFLTVEGYYASWLL
jgi:hypothetical protein